MNDAQLIDDQRRAILNLLEDLEKEKEEVDHRVAERTNELARAKAHVDTLIESLVTGLVEYDEHFTIVRINRMAERMLGVQREEIIGRQVLPQDASRPGWQSLVEVSYPVTAAHQRKLSASMVGETATANEITISYPRPLDVQVITTPIVLGGGTPGGFIKVLRDVTRENLIARSKSEFISIAAHQLRTPLSIIKWSLSAVLERDDPSRNAGDTKHLGDAYDTNERMIALVNDLLDVARIEEGRFGYSLSKGNVLAIFEDLVREYTPLAKSRSLSLSYSAPEKTIPELFFDRAKLSLALHAILDNAFRYTPDGGKIILAIRLDDTWVECTCRDTGIGIPTQQMNRLFSKFFRADNAVQHSPNGSGLGLFIVRNIIERHGGTIDVQSEEGRGTAVRIRLPTEAPPERELDESIV